MSGASNQTETPRKGVSATVILVMVGSTPSVTYRVCSPALSILVGNALSYIKSAGVPRSLVPDESKAPSYSFSACFALDLLIFHAYRVAS